MLQPGESAPITSARRRSDGRAVRVVSLLLALTAAAQAEEPVTPPTADAAGVRGSIMSGSVDTRPRVRKTDLAGEASGK